MALESGTMAVNGKARSGGPIGEARLVGHPGVGVLQVWRGQHGQALDVAGTWRHDLHDQAGAGEREDLERALREGRPVPYEGTLYDPGQPEKATIRTSVRISSIGEYAYLVEPEDPQSATVQVVLVNFRPVDDIEGV